VYRLEEKEARIVSANILAK